MEITIKVLLGDYNRSYQYEKVEVEMYTSFRGYDIFKGKDGFLYVKTKNDWNFFATINECKMFIKNIFTNN